MKQILLIGDIRSSLTRERMQAIIDQGQFEVICYARFGGELNGARVYDLKGLSSSKLVHLIEWLYLLQLILRTRPLIIHVFWANHGLANFVLARFRRVVVTVMGGDIMPDRSCAGARRTS